MKARSKESLIHFDDKFHKMIGSCSTYYFDEETYLQDFLLVNIEGMFLQHYMGSHAIRRLKCTNLCITSHESSNPLCNSVLFIEVRLNLMKD